MSDQTVNATTAAARRAALLEILASGVFALLVSGRLAPSAAGSSRERGLARSGHGAPGATCAGAADQADQSNPRAGKAP